MREEILSVDIVLPVRDPALEEEISWFIWEAGVEGFEQHDSDTARFLSDDPRPLPEGAIRWRINLEIDRDVAEVQAEFDKAFADFPQLHIDVWTRDITGYRTAWMEHFNPTQVSKRILIHPPWDKGNASAPIRVEIDPGMAFGTGTHETTQLCLQLLDDLDLAAGKEVLDVGMGSGILSIAAAKLGAKSVRGMDIDPESTREATRNAAVNGVERLCTFHTGELSDEDAPADLVIANILPHILIDISKQLIAHTRNNGTLILSGILLSEAETVRSHFAAAGLKQTHQVSLNEWSALVFVHDT